MHQACLRIARWVVCVVLCLCTFVVESRAQGAIEAEPLEGRSSVVPSSELVLMWADPDGTSMVEKLYDYVSFGNPALPDSIQAQGRIAVSTQYAYGEDEAMSVAVGAFDKDAEDDIVAVWQSTDGGIFAHHPTTRLNTSSLLPELEFQPTEPYLLKPAGTLYSELPEEHTIRVVAAQFDTDVQEELLLAYINAEGDIVAEVYSALSPNLVLEFEDVLESLPLSADESTIKRSLHFDVHAGDINADGVDEIVLSTVRWITDGCAANSGCWAATVYAYEVEPRRLTRLGMVDTQTKTDNANRWIESIAVDVGDFDGDGVGEIVTAVHVPQNGSTHRWYLNGIQWDGASLSLAYDEQFHQTNGSFGFPLGIQAKDMDLDGTDELVIAGRTLEVYKADSLFTDFRKIAGGSYGPESNNTGRQYLAVGDIDGASRMWYSNAEPTIFVPEIVVARSYDVSDNGGISVDEVTELAVFRFTPGQFNLDKVAVKADERTDATRGRQLMMAAGDFGDRGIRVGAPNYYRETDIVQPLVILNAPPIHFDVFENNAFDVSSCFDAGGCGFAARYTEQASQSVEITTQVSGDWQIGAGIEGGLNEILNEIPVAGELVGGLLDALNVGVDFSFEASYGEGFSDLLGTRKTITLTTQVNALEEDVVYANVLDYDVWEYPLFVRGQQVGHIAIVLPRPERDQWLSTGSPDAASYRPAHEVGNILSYPRDLSPSRQVQQVYRGSTFTLGSQTIAWDITKEEASFSESSRTTNLQLGGALDISLPVPTLGLNLNGDYSTRTMNTHATQVSNLQGVTIEFGQVESNIEGKQANYSVTPFVYWESGGALVVDYAVEPSIANVGDVETWWQDRYGKAPDPAFNLPARYADVKSGNAVSAATKTRTRDIVFFPESALPGEEVTIRALINNYSLLAVPSETPVRFYAGDPNDGGTPITGTSAKPDPILPPMEPRGNAMVETRWVLPAGFTESAQRIYAVVDPGNTLTEIHKTNNTGWAPLPIAIPTSVDFEEPIEGVSLSLNANYPNPFSETTTLSFTIERPQDVRLRVFDVLGREIITLVDGWREAGAHPVRFDAANLASGLYIYRLEAGNHVETRTMIKAR